MDVPLTCVVLHDEALLVLSRRLDGVTAPAAHAAIEAAIAAGARIVVVDLSDVALIDDGGVAVLAATAASLGARGGRLVVALRGGLCVEFSDAETVRAALEL